MKDDLNNIVRSSFEGSGAEKAPDNLWSAISDELEQSGVDTIVKDSFEGQRDAAPEMVWERVQDQLDIDRVWFNIAGRISIRRYGYYLHFAAMILLLLLPFNLDYNFFETAEVGNAVNSGDNSSTEYVTSTEDNNGQVQNEIVSNDVFTYPSNVGNSTSPEIDPNPNISSNNSSFDLKTFDTRLASLDLIDLNNALVPTMKPLFSPKPKRSIGLSVGAVSSLENTWVLDNSTRSGFDENSLVENEFSLGASYGVFAEYQIKPRFSITGEYIFQSRVNQHSHFYENGLYSHKEQEINSYKISLLAGWNTRPKFNGVSHCTVLRIGGYYTGVKSNFTHVNNTIREVNTIRKQHDGGVRMELGKKIYLRPFAIEGGLKVDYGLANLASQKSYIPAHLNFTRVVSGGLYLKAAYSF